MQKTLVLATTNKGKITEFRQMLETFKIEVRGLTDYSNCPVVEEDGLTFEANAIKKATAISQFLGLPALADDSGLEVDYLGGRPGVYSARFAGPQATDEENIQKLIHSMQEAPIDVRNARFRCALALAVPGRKVWTCDGVCEEELTLEPQGSNGFGYDPVFFLPELNRTMAQLEKEEKNRISHRGKAVREFLENIHELLE